MKMKFDCRLKLIFAEEKLKDRNFTQEKFAKKVGVTPTTMSKIALGQTPTFEVAYKIALELGKKIEDIWVLKA